jgi:hypothetical protein
MEYYGNSRYRKTVANRFIGLRLILRVGWSMRASGHVQVREPHGDHHGPL